MGRLDIRRMIAESRTGAPTTAPAAPRPAAAESGDDESTTTPIRPIITNDRAGFIQALTALDADLRFNTLLDRREWRIRHSTGWIPDTKRTRALIAADIREGFCFAGPLGKPPKSAVFGMRGRFEEISDALFAVHEYDPWQAYLDSLQWDRTKRIDHILCDHFGAQRDELTEWASRYIFTAAVMRTRQPGAKIDEHPVIVGKRGTGKTSFVQRALPPRFADHFRHLALQSDKMAMESLQGCIVAEVGEGHWLTKRDRAWIKDFLTRTDDGAGIRKAYRRDPVPQKRRAAIVITADHDEALPNDPNLRRFVPVTLQHGCNVEALYEEHRDQYWAEAVHRVDHEALTARLPRHLMDDAHERAQLHRSTDLALEDAVVKVLDGSGDYCRSPRLVSEVAAEVPNIRSNRLIYDAARSAGWEPLRRRHIHGQPAFRAWVRVSADASRDATVTPAVTP